MADAMSAAALIVELTRSTQRTRWTCAAGTTLYIYEIVLTFGDEVEYLWQRLTFTLPNVLYILNRYVSLAFFLAASYAFSPFRGELSDAYCRAPLVFVGICLIAQNTWLAILTIRVCAMCRQQVTLVRIIQLFCAAVVVSTVVIQAILYRMVGVTTTYNPVLDLCLPAVEGKDIPTSFWVYCAMAPALYEVFLTIVTIAKGFSYTGEFSWKNRPTLYRIITRDGVAYLLVFTAVAIVNALSWTYIPSLESYLMLYIHWAIFSSIIARIVLNLRMAHFRATHVSLGDGRMTDRHESASTRGVVSARIPFTTSDKVGDNADSMDATDAYNAPPRRSRLLRSDGAITASRLRKPESQFKSSFFLGDGEMGVRIEASQEYRDPDERRLSKEPDLPQSVDGPLSLEMRPLD